MKKTCIYYIIIYNIMGAYYYECVDNSKRDMKLNALVVLSLYGVVCKFGGRDSSAALFLGCACVRLSLAHVNHMQEKLVCRLE